ncbi:MAG: cupredoxin family copper-binding protein [Micromonosporaceae bacterium]|nr:cupredoxin family copper-binding protein [Micromonosporaceae bacterium]
MHLHSWGRRYSRAGALLVTLVLSLAGCAGSSNPAAAPGISPGNISPGKGQNLAGTPGSTGSGPVSAMPPMVTSSGGSAAGPGTAAVAGDAVAIRNFAFSPATLTVKVGTTVTWTNQDTDAHTVTSQNGGPLKSAALDQGQSYSYTFSTPGTYAYLCTIHPFMTATVKVSS